MSDIERLRVELGGCEFRENVNDASMCLCGLPALGHDEAVMSILRRDYLTVFALLDRAEESDENLRAMQVWRRRCGDAEEKVERLVKVHEDYFDMDLEPFDTGPEPEDVWRYDRDFRAALQGEPEEKS